jgi:hypothetical protein
MGYRFILEKYRGGESRHTCPSCGRPNEFTHYLDTETGRYVDGRVGRCNRESKCGYHYTPKEFFQDNPALKADGVASRPRKNMVRETALNILAQPSFIRAEGLKRTLTAYDRNGLITFLSKRCPTKEISNVARRYLVGTWTDGRTVFWQIDASRRIRTGKLIAYDPEVGKRIKSRNVSWVHSELKRTGELSGEFVLEQCLFGEHLLSREPGNAVGLVESEKTAIVASLFMPDYLWLATGGIGNLKPERLGVVLRGRRVVIFPDSSAFGRWAEKAAEAQRLHGLNVRVSELLERRLNPEQRREDYDMADFLLAKT